MSDGTFPVLIAGNWRESRCVSAFTADDSILGRSLPEQYPISSWEDALDALAAGRESAAALRIAGRESIGQFLDDFAQGIESRVNDLVDMAHLETGLPRAGRLKDVELPRTVDQLRQAAGAARDGGWRRAVSDHPRNVHSFFAPLGGPVVVMAPNNFPFAFNAVAGGDFAAAIVAQNPVIAKANPGHPGTTRLFAEIAHQCAIRSHLPPATIQLLYHVENDAGLALVSHPFVAATAFTGSRPAGLKLKAAADKGGRLFYAEMSSLNPVVLLEGALLERGDKIAGELAASCTRGAGQFCTRPGLVIVPDSAAGESFLASAKAAFEAAPAEVLLSGRSLEVLRKAVGLLTGSGVTVLAGGSALAGPSYRFANTLLTVSGDAFLNNPEELQTEAFGPVSLIVVSRNAASTVAIINRLEGNLTGTIYSAGNGRDDEDYNAVEPHLRQRVGRLINDKMPTGVAVSPAMNHGGPFPATAHPGFTSVGLPASIQRFAALQCYDNVPAHRLPAAFR